METKQKSFIINSVECAVRTAGKKALEMQSGKLNVQSKGIKDLVTDADHWCDAYLRKTLTPLIADAGFWTEESSFNPSALNKKYLWIIDPIDGTVNYSRGIPFWGVAVALMRGEECILSFSYLPVFDEMYIAEKEGGAFCNGIAIKVSDTQNLEEAIVSNGDFNVGSREENNKSNLNSFALQAEAIARVKCFGSAVAEATLVACGRLDGYLMQFSHPWDIAGGGLLVQEAGGSFSNSDGSPWELKDQASVVFSNGILHQDLIKLI